MGLVYKNLIVAVGLAAMATGCSNGDTSYSLLSSGQSFKQATVNTKVDILWVVDNSGSMKPLQDNMTANFNSFISQFVTKGYDFHLSVVGTDAYKAEAGFQNNPVLAKFRDGAGSSHSGIFTILPGTPDLLNTFVINASLGMTSSGDERAFSSFKSAMVSPLNSGFLRSDSFLGVIILSDEDDFSNPTRPENSFAGGDHNYAQPGLESVDSYVNFLDTQTNTTGAFRRYSVSAIAVLDEACRAQHGLSAPSTSIGNRYMELANKTDGILGSVCDASYANSLQEIQQHIMELSTQFYLSAKPVEASIQVSVNGVNVPMDASNGWTYNAAANSIIFHGTSVPASGASVSVNFDPESLNL